MEALVLGDKERLADEAYRRGYYHQGHERCCSQSVVASIMETCRFKDKGIFQASTALAGGGALFGDTGCGAYTGGLLILGFLKGRSFDNFVVEERDRFKCFEIGRVLHQRFIDEYGTAICRDIQTKVYGRPFWAVDPDEYRKVDLLGAHSTVGPEIVAKGARWTIETIFDEGLLPELNALRNRSPYTDVPCID
ncbi:MAG: C-GCAxxG-C-C family protein [Candidatus Thorarchaeota archaeon]